MSSQHFSNCARIVVAFTMVCSSAYAQSQASSVSFNYDDVGNVIEIIDPLLRSTKFNYDELSRKTAVVSPDSTISQYDYDSLDEIISIKDPRGIQTFFSTDGFSNTLKTVSSDTGTTVNTFDLAGNLTSQVNGKQQKATYSYDVLDRPIIATYADGSTAKYDYDLGAYSVGRLSRITDISGTIEYFYDRHGRVTGEKRMIGGTTYMTGYRYDVSGRLAGMDYPTGRSIEYTRDALGRVIQINTSQGSTVLPIITQVTYQPFGTAQSVAFANGQTQVRNFDLDGRLVDYSLSTKNMVVSYDAAGRITGFGDAANSAAAITYGYDMLDRLTNVLTPSVAQTYAYDAVGNRIQKVINSSVTSYGYTGAGNRLTLVGNKTITTDANGSITDKGDTRFKYDARGRIVSAETAIGLVTYTINSLGQRVRKVTPTETTVFHYDLSGKLIAETTSAGAVVVKTDQYIYLGDVPVAVLK